MTELGVRFKDRKTLRDSTQHILRLGGCRDIHASMLLYPSVPDAGFLKALTARRRRILTYTFQKFPGADEVCSYSYFLTSPSVGTTGPFTTSRESELCLQSDQI